MQSFLTINPGDSPNQGRDKINYNFSLIDGGITGGTGIFTGGTVSGDTNFSANLSGATLFSGSTNLENLFSTHDYYVTGVTFNTGNYQLNVNQNDGSSYVADLSILSTDMTVTGGTYDLNTGIVTFANNSGGTFQVSGFASGYTDHYVTGGTYSSGTLTLNRQDGSFSITGFSTGGGVINVSGTTLYSTSPATSNFSTTESIFFGTQAGSGAIGASYSNFLGYQSGNGATNASYSNFLGQSAGNGATNASNSNFFGSNAGNGATGAFQSNFFGQSAGQNATSALLSNFFGQLAGNGATGASLSNFLGQSAGNGARNASNSNFFGSGVGRTFAGNNLGSNNIIIGTNISLPNATANAINIGGVLFGINTYSTVGGNPSIAPRANGRIGIGVVTPTETLHVSGNTLINGGLTAATMSATAISGGTYFSGSTPLATIIQNIASQYASSGGTLTGNFLSLSGGTVTGDTNFTQSLSANSISASTYFGVKETEVVPSIIFVASPGSEYILNIGASKTVKINLSNGANLNLKLSGYTSGSTGNIWLMQGSAGTSTLTMTGNSYTNYVVNGGSGNISLSNSPNAIDIISYITDGVNMFWSTGYNYT